MKKKSLQLKHARPLFVLLMLALFAPVTGWGQQTLTVCDGSVSGTTTTTNDYIPIYGLFVDTQGQNSEFIIPATTEGMDDMVNGVISKLAFYITNSPQSWGSPTVQVYMGEVEGTTISAMNGPTNFTTVWTGTLSNQNATMEITLSEPYTYEGGNLLIGMYVQTKSTTYKTTYFSGITAPSGSSRYNSGSGSGSAVSFLPKTTFTYTAGAPSTCPKPKNLAASNVTASSAVLTWEAGGDETAWMVEYKTADATEWTLVSGTVNTPTYTLNGLTATTNYQARVQADCNEGKYVSTSFTTPCGTYNIPYTYDFETEAPFACWTSIAGVTRASGTSYANNSTYYLRFAGTTSNLVALPQFNVPTNTLRVEFYTRPEGYTYSSCGTFSVGYMTDITDASTFVEVQNYAYNEWTSNTHVKKTVDFNNAPANTNIAFRHNAGSTSYYWFVDDVTVKEIPSCLAPSNLTVSDITVNSAKLAWDDNGATQWQYMTVAHGAGEPDWTSPYVITSNTHANVPANILAGTGQQPQPNTQYDFWVRANCGGDFSEAAMLTFRTACGAITSFPWSEDFNSYSATASSTIAPSNYPNDELPGCWTFLNRSESSSTYPQAFLTSYSDYAVSGNCLFFKSSSATPLYAILPEFDENISELQLILTYRNEGTSASNGTLYIGYMTDPTDANSFTSVYTCTQTTTKTTIDPVYFANAPAGSRIALRYQGGSSNNYYLGVDDVIVDMAPSCIPPTSLAVSNITGHTADLAWTNGNLETAWQICLNGDETNLINITTNPYTLTNLTAETAYTVKLRANCGSTDGTSDWSNTVNFTTEVACPAPTALAANNVTAHSADLSWSGSAEGYNIRYGTANILLQDFSDMGDWTMSNCHSSTGISNGSFSFHWNSTPPQYLISPEVSVLNNNTTLSFTYWQTSTSYTETFMAGYSSTTNEPDQFIWGSEISVSDQQQHTYQASLPIGTKFVAIKYTSNNQYYLYIDNVFISDDWTNINNTSSPYTLTGLSPETFYMCQVQADCGLEGLSSESGPITFTTLVACPAPTSLAASNVMSHTADISWTENGEASDWVLEYGTASDFTGATSVNISTNPTAALSGLAPETTYYARVKANCGSEDGESSWSNIVNFATEVACPAPTALAANNITTNSAEISWTGSADSYNLRYTKFYYGFETAEPWVVDDFTPCTTYDGDGGETYGFDSWSFTNEAYTGACIAFNNDNESSTNMYSHSGNAFGVMINAVPSTIVNGTTSNDWFILPELTIENGDEFSFWAREITDQYGAEIINVGVYGSTQGTLSSYLAQNLEVSSTTWTQYSYDLSAYAGQTIRLAINCVSDDVFGFMFDDIFVGYEVENNIASNQFILIGLEPNTEYRVQVQADCGSTDGTSQWSDMVSFTTLSECEVPNSLSANIAATSATLDWDGVQESYNVRYRELLSEPVEMTYNFDDGTTQTWTTIDADGHGDAWNIYYSTSATYSGDYCMRATYNSDYAHQDYLVSPQITLGGTLSFYAKRYGTSFNDNFRVYLSTSGNTSATDFTIELTDGDVTPNTSYAQYTYDLSGYTGEGYVAIVYTAAANQAWLYIDDITIVKPGEYGSWQTVSDVTSLHTIAGLTPETTYEWQVQGVNTNCTGGVTDWSEAATFTTEALVMECETEDFSGVTATDLYPANPLNMPDGWKAYGEAPDFFIPHVSNYSNLFSDNYLLLITNRDDGSSPSRASYVVAPHKNIGSFEFDYVYENASQGTFELGYVTDNTGYSTFVALATPEKVSTISHYAATSADLATIMAHDGYLTLRMSGATGAYYGVGIDNVHYCYTPEKLWTDFVTQAPATWTWDGTSNTINITCAEDLAWLISVVNGYNGCTANSLEGKTVSLTAPIMSMLEHVWVPIGYNTTTPFKGTFDGNGNPIAGIHIDYNSNETDYVEQQHGVMTYAGMFGYAENATIKNLSLIYGQEGEYHGDTWMSSERDGGYLGAIVGYGKNLDVEFCHVLHVLGAHANLNSVGGIVGYAETTSGNHAIKASSANGHFALSENLTITNLGGLAGYSNDSITNCFSMPVSVDLKYDGNSTPTGTVVTNRGAVVGYGTKVSNVYVHPLALTEVTKVNGNNQSSYFYALAGEGFTDVTSTFSEAVPRTYGSYSTNNTIGGTPFADVLNEHVTPGYKWITPPSTDINMGYPLIVRTDDDAPNAVLSAFDTSDEQLTGVNVFVDVNVLIPFVDDETVVYMFGNGNIESNVPSSVRFYIDENAAVTQSDETTVNATVGVTLKNTEEGSAEADRDWHLFSPTIEAGKTGVIYGTQDTDEPDESLEFGSDYYLTQGDPAVYFPDGITVSIDEPGKQFDLYSFYEPEYHWINLKRTKDNHWHQDVVEGDGNIAYDDTDNENGAAFTRGKGYLVALGNNSTKNNNFMQAKGVLNSGHVTVPVTAEGEHLTGYNLIGNPYQSYLDFNKFANANKNLWANSESIGYKSYLIYNADKGGFVEYLVDNEGVSFSQGAAQDGDRYINMHQGFFVVKNGTATEAVFEDTMRVTNQTPHFRDELPAYPLVNLFCTDSDGKQEVSVIEFDRPANAGSLKMKGMLNGKGNMYVHWGSDDFGSVFIDHMPDFVPVWFDAAEDGVFTMTWNTANANFGYMHLIDNMTGVDYDCLANDSYTFEAHVNDMSARFRLVFSALGIEEETTEQSENFAFINGNELVVNGEGELSFIDLNGRVLATQYVSGQQSHITMPKVAVGMYMLRLTNGNETKVQKIVIRK